MSRTLVIALSAILIAGCSTSEFASQCDGLSDLDEQTACLDAGFDTLRVQQADCHGDDLEDRLDDCYDGCMADRGLSDEECRLACYDGDDDDRGDDDRGDDDGDDRGDEEPADEDECFDGCMADRGLSEEECREACSGDGGDDDRDDDDRGDRAQGDLDDLHLATRGEVQDSDRSRERRDLIRAGLSEGEDLARCEN